MARPTTLSKEWLGLIETVGGINGVCDALGVSQSTFYRAARGHNELPEEKKHALEILCELYELPNPLVNGPKPWARDLTPLKLLGDAMAKGFPPAPRTVERLRGMFPTEQLVKLAEADGTPEVILRAVALLLEDA